MTRPSSMLWLRSGGVVSSGAAPSGRREPVRETRTPARHDGTPTRVLVGPSGPVRPSAVEQVRAADAAAVALCVDAMQPAPDARRSTRTEAR